MTGGGEMGSARQQYLYVLKLIPRLLDGKNWTDEENGIVDDHFKALQRLQADGTLILAGRTLDMDPDRFGIVIFNADSADKAQAIMESDPAVRQGVMTARLFPYNLALIAERNAH